MKLLAWQAFEFEPHRQLTVLVAGCCILCSIHSADETQPARNSCPEFAIFGFQFGLTVDVTLRSSFLRSVSLEFIVFVFLFNFGLIRAVAAPTYTYSIIVRGPLLSVFSFNISKQAPD